MPKVRLKPFKNKLIILIIIPVAIISGAYYYYSYQNFRKLNKAAEKKQVENVKQYLLSCSETYLATGDSLGYEDDLSRILQGNNIAYVIVNDSKGKLKKALNYETALKFGYLPAKEVNEYIYEEDVVTNVVTPVIYKNKYIGSVLFGLYRSEFINAEKVAKKQIAFISLGIFALGFVLTFLISLLITRPFNTIFETAKKIAEGDYSQRINIKRNDEFSIIAKLFNNLAERLEESSAQVIHLNNQLKTTFKDKLGELNLEINQRRHAEDSLRKSEEQFRLLFNIAPIGMVITTPSRKILRVNKAFENTLGYDTRDLLNMTTVNLTYYDDKEKDEQIYTEFLNNEIDNKTFEKKMVTKNGNIIETIIRTTLYRDEKRNPALFIEQVIDVTEQNKMQKELIVAKNRAEESDKMKSAFLAQMSHEIRTPLNVIIAASSILDEEVREHLDETSQQVVDSVKSAGKRLLRTIDLILNMSAIQTGKYEPEFEKIRINDLLKSMVHEFMPLCCEKKIGLNFETHVDNAEIKADLYTVQQIFQNVISNAIKYTRKGQVDVVVFKTDKIFVEIKDTGIGMSKDYMDKLFNPFSQEDMGHKREFEGNGLGLALVNKYAEINEATIKVESEKDKGSKFTIIFNN